MEQGTFYSETCNHTPSGPKVHNGDCREVIKLEFSDSAITSDLILIVISWKQWTFVRLDFTSFCYDISRERYTFSSSEYWQILMNTSLFHRLLYSVFFPSQCSGPCNLTSSVQTRQAQCVNSESVAVEPSACDKSSKPQLSRKCQDCSYWVEKPWSRVSENHRGVIKYLVPLCINYLSI